MFQPTEKKAKSAADNADNAMSDYKSGKNELRNAKDKALSGASSALDEAGDKIESKVRHLRDQARDAGEKVQHFLHDRQDELVHARDSAERTIRANPLASAAAAFAVGAVISRLFKRS